MKKEKVIVYIGDFKLVGYFHLNKPGARISDHLNQSAVQFIPLTEVVFYNKEGQKIKEEQFVCINKDKILILEGREEPDE